MLNIRFTLSLPCMYESIREISDVNSFRSHLAARPRQLLINA